MAATDETDSREQFQYQCLGSMQIHTNQATKLFTSTPDKYSHLSEKHSNSQKSNTIHNSYWPVAFVIKAQCNTVYCLLVTEHQVETILQHVNQTSQSQLPVLCKEVSYFTMLTSSVLQYTSIY